MKSQFKSFTYLSAIAAGILLVATLGQAQTNRPNPNLYRQNLAKTSPKSVQARGATAGNTSKTTTAPTNNYFDPGYYQFGPNPYSAYPNPYANPYSPFANGYYPGNYNGYNQYNVNPYNSSPYGYYRGY
jgi:hypothetical protein